MHEKQDHDTRRCRSISWSHRRAWSCICIAWRCLPMGQPPSAALVSALSAHPMPRCLVHWPLCLPEEMPSRRCHRPGLQEKESQQAELTGIRSRSCGPESARNRTSLLITKYSIKIYLIVSVRLDGHAVFSVNSAVLIKASCVRCSILWGDKQPEYIW